MEEQHWRYDDPSEALQQAWEQSTVAPLEETSHSPTSPHRHTIRSSSSFIPTLTALSALFFPLSKLPPLCHLQLLLLLVLFVLGAGETQSRDEPLFAFNLLSMFLALSSVMGTPTSHFPILTQPHWTPMALLIPLFYFLYSLFSSLRRHLWEKSFNCALIYLPLTLFFIYSKSLPEAPPSFFYLTLLITFFFILTLFSAPLPLRTLKRHYYQPGGSLSPSVIASQIEYAKKKTQMLQSSLLGAALLLTVWSWPHSAVAQCLLLIWILALRLRADYLPGAKPFNTHSVHALAALVIAGAHINLALPVIILSLEGIFFRARTLSPRLDFFFSFLPYPLAPLFFSLLILI